jgi:hypothetical protein
MQNEPQQAYEVVAPRRNAFLLWMVVVFVAVRFALPANFRWGGAIVLLLGMSFPLVWRFLKRRK